MEPETRLLIWFFASLLWVAFATYNMYAVAMDLYITLTDEPSLDEKTIAWQRFRDTLFRFFLAWLFTFVAFVNRQTSPRESEIREVETWREVMILVIVFTPVLGAIFEGWRIVDRKRMGDAYRALYRRNDGNR